MTTDETTSGAGQSTTLHQVTTSDNALGETGNEISGDFTSTDNPTITTTLDQSGYNAAGSFSLHETSSDSPTVTTTGNSISGLQTIATTGDLTYGVTQTNTSGSDDYTLTESGDKNYSRTENDAVQDGTVSILETGTDTYTLSETGTQGGTAYTQSVTGTDTYTSTASQNSQTGTFATATAGTDDYSTGATAGSNFFSTSQSGNTFAGTVSLSQTGTSRYGLLQQFNNTSDGANGGGGIADFSPVGLPVIVQRSSVPAGTFSSIGDAAHLYCFAAGTKILLADHPPRNIEDMEEGLRVPASPDTAPESTPKPCHVLKVFRNPPAPIWHVTVNGELIRTTANHPFYARGRGWVAAAQLQPGDQLRTFEGGWAAVESVADSGSVEPVFNLQVEQARTYFVQLPGGAAVLVHNTSSGQAGQGFWDQMSGGLQAISNWLLTNEISDDRTMYTASRNKFDQVAFDRTSGVQDAAYSRGTRIAHKIDHSIVVQDGIADKFAFDQAERANAAQVGGKIIDLTALAVSTVSGGQSLAAVIKAGGLAGTVTGVLTNGQTITAIVVNGKAVALSASALINAGISASAANSLLMATTGSGGSSANNQPPLSRLHPDSTLTGRGNASSYSYWSKQRTQDIIDSLKPGSEEPLTVDANGKVWDGNTRIKILQDRGVDVNNLPRVPK